MNYIGEHLWLGQAGHILNLVSFVASIIATVAFFTSTLTEKNQEDSARWVKLGRIFFYLETVCVFATFLLLYIIISNHYFEYKYAYMHSDKSLQPEYLLSCFWEGQEGSFMLWSFWHCVLGIIIMWSAKKWEGGVMAVISFAQVMLASMVLGIYLFGHKIGSSPFSLLRDEMNWPILSRPDYLTLIKDGTGLNTLLQNYWMVIHPPILFLGFASTIVPFGYAMAGFMRKSHDWIKPAIPWASFSAAILGTGIMMGAAWAYESLSFGGYWAWDPVENASLVPWLTLVAGLHTNLVARSTGYSLRPTYFFYIVSFLLILYSTFLTRSGILGDTSVHAFTDLGMNTQLLTFLLIFVIPAFTIFAIRYKSIPSIAKEEETSSREFWMFIGSLVLFLAGMVIIAKTSTPVANKLFGTNIAPPEDPEFAHNQIQIFVAIVLGLLTAGTQFLKYKVSDTKQVLKNIVWPLAAAAAISLLIAIFGGVNYTKKGPVFLFAIHVAIFAAVYAVTGNLSYIWLVLKGKLKAAGASVAHVGFGMILVGILISSAKKTVLSWNTTGVTPLAQAAPGEKNPAGNPAENLTLFKGVETDMGKFMVNYKRDTLNEADRKKYYEISFKAKDGSEAFNLYPDVIKNNKGMEGFAANPASKHYWYKDIFVYITSFQQNDATDTTRFVDKEIKVGDTIFYSNGLMVLQSVSVNPAAKKDLLLPGETALFLNVDVTARDGRKYSAMPGIAIDSTSIRQISDTVVAQSLVLQFNKVINQEKGILEIGVKESGSITDLITLKVYEFPMINILWLGILVMVVGFGMSIFQRYKSLKNKLKIS
jgi:cytochrome c-type biogenesis protein CcmF